MTSETKYRGHLVGEWSEQAVCSDAHPDVMFPHGDDDALYVTARTYCRRCPVKEQCLDHALANREEVGMWGNKTPRERVQIIAQRQRAADRTAANR